MRLGRVVVAAALVSSAARPSPAGERPSVSWNAAREECESRGQGLCSSEELCPTGAPFDGGVYSSDTWVPVSDGSDEWLQYGKWANGPLCSLHSVQHAPDPHPCHTHHDPVRYPDAASCGHSFLYCCGDYAPWIPQLPEPPTVCDNSKCSRQLSLPCRWPYAYTFDRRCTPLAANDPYMDDFVPFLLERCAKDEHCSGVFEPLGRLEPEVYSHDGTLGYLTCDARHAPEALPASNLYDTQGVIITCAGSGNCSSPSYVGPVFDRACARTARLGQISEGAYEIIDHPWSYYDGARSRMGLKECAAAVRALAGTGCDGEYFYWSPDITCRCVTDHCAARIAALDDWQLYKFGCPDAAGNRPAANETCRSDICTDYGWDCCAPFPERPGCSLAGYAVRSGGVSRDGACEDPDAVYQCCATEPGAVEPTTDFDGCLAGYYTCANCCDQDADCSCDGLGGDAYAHEWRTPRCPEGYYECGDCCDRDADCACDSSCTARLAEPRPTPAPSPRPTPPAAPTTTTCVSDDFEGTSLDPQWTSSAGGDGECALSGAGVLVCKNANNGAHIRTANTIIEAPLMISGSLDKTDDCSDHYIKVSTQSTDSGAPWSNRPGFVTFVWNCDYRAIYGQTGVVSTYSPSRQTYDIEITIDESTVTFRDPTEAETVTIDCRNDICTDYGDDCCASEHWDEPRGCRVAGFVPRSGGQNYWCPEEERYECCGEVSGVSGDLSLSDTIGASGPLYAYVGADCDGCEAAWDSVEICSWSEAPTSAPTAPWPSDCSSAGRFKYEGHTGYCVEADGEIYDVLLVEDGQYTCRHTDENSCPAGFDIWVPRSYAHALAVVEATGWYDPLVGIYRDERGCGSCQGYAMNSDAMATYGGVGWKSVAGDPWFMRLSSYSEPNGDYEAGCWLGTHGWTENEGFEFFDYWCRNCRSSYLCSRNGAKPVPTPAPTTAAPTATPAPTPAPTTATPTATLAPIHEGENVRVTTSGSFVHVDQAKSFDDARAYCRAHYHDLASIHSSSENAAVAALCHGGCWIGGSDAAQEGTWTWSDGTAWDYENWEFGEPNNGGGDEPYIVISDSGRWNDDSRYGTYPFVCGWEICSLAYHDNVSQPEGWCPVGYHDCGDCCDFSADCECARVRRGVDDGSCGPGVDDLACSVRKARRTEHGDHHTECTEQRPWTMQSENCWDGIARAPRGQCCAGPNEVPVCEDGYTVVPGDAPCVFTCCKGDAEALTATEVDRAGAVCWEAHANEGKFPVPHWAAGGIEFHYLCCDDSSDHCPNTTSKVYIVDDGTRHGWDEGEWFRETECRARIVTFWSHYDMSGQYWEIRKTDPFTKPTRRGDCNADACRSFKPGGPRIAALEDVVDRDPGDLGLNYNDDCSRVAPPIQGVNVADVALRAFGPPAAARYCADGHRLAGMDYVPGVGACCTNATAPAGCVAPLPVCFHETGLRRCDVLLKYFGAAYDAVPAHKIEELYGKGGTAGWTGRAAGIEHVRDRPCGFSPRRAPYACDDLRCDPDTQTLYYVRSHKWRWWSFLDYWFGWYGRSPCHRSWWRTDLPGRRPWPHTAKNRWEGERMRIRACGVVTADGDFFHAQLREKKRWDEAGCAGCRNTCAGCADRAPESASISGEAPYRTPWHGADFRVEPLGDPYYRHHEKHHEHEQPETYVEHPWTHFWASSRAPRRWSGLEARPTAAAADACAQDAEREFYSGCLGTCGKTCDELGHDPVLFEKLKDAVKRWPDAGGGEAIPDVCGFDATIAWDADPTWWTWRQVLAILALVGLWAAGVAWACCISQPTCWGYARLQKIRNWAADGKLTRWGLFWCCGGWFFASLELCLRRPALLFVTVVPVVLAVTLSGQLGAGAAALFFFLFFGGLLIVFREQVRARYEKFCERRSWFGRHVAPILEKLSPCVGKISAGAAAVAWPFRKGAAAARSCLARYCYCLCDSFRRCLVKRPPAAVYTAEDGTEQTAPWVVAPGPPGTIVTRPDGIKVKVPEGVQRGQLFSLAEAAPAGDGAVAPKHAAEPPSLTERTALLARKAWIIKKRTTAALAKQVFVPLLGVGVLWLLYNAREENRLARSTVASDTSATSAPTAVTKTRKRTTFDTNHGDFELVIFQLFFVPWVQVVASALVGDVAQGTREATRAAGGADAAYWLASFLVEGVAVGGGVAVAIAAGAAPGLFRRAGKSFEVAAFLELFALHWLFLLALVLQTFVVVTCLLRSQIAAAGLPPLLHAALHGCYLLWAPLRTWNVGKRRYKTNWRLRARPRAHFASALLPQFAYDLLVDSFSPTKKRAGWRCWLVDDGFVGERYPCEKCRKECWEKAPRPRREAFEQHLARKSLTAAPCADEHLMCEDVWPFWYEKTEDRGWRPESAWTAGVYCMLMVSVVLWAAVLWYVIQVSTSAARGKGKDLLFCLRKAYWRPPPPDEVVEKAPLVDHDEWFENDKDSDAPVQVRGLRKVFGKKVAVSDATFAIRDSEIFCLLGHNGAGKTTTMSMMTGAMAPDGGSASFFGIRTLGPLADADGLDRLRQLLGFCPQHDALFPRLTLREHLIFYSRLKGVEESRAENEASGLLELFRLTEMAEGFPLKLSGGQKRKVMMAAALTGGSRLVVLDEPTAGMDPVARREVWTLLRDVRVDRSVLLTTHHMEEAEALADRVAIMAAGSVKCCGTLSFLKRRFGGGGDAADGADTSDTSIGGLHVAVTTAAAARDQLKAVFAQHMPKAKLAAASKLEEDLRRATEKDAANPLLGSTPKSFSSSFKSPLLNATRGSSFSASRNWADGAEAPLLEDSARDVTTTYTIHASRSRVAALFEGLEAEADGLGLVDVSVTATSLEDVFISVGEQVEGAAAPVEAETLVGGALLPSAPGEPVPAGRLVAAVVQFRLQQIRDDLVWIKKFVLGGAALPGGLRRAVKRARGDKGGATTFTVPTHFAVLAAVLSSGFIVGLAVGLTEKGSRDSPRGWAAGTAAGSAVAASTLALAALECGIRFIGGASLSAPFSVAGCVVGSVFGVCVCGLNAQHHFVLHAFTGGLTWAIATAVAVGLEAGLRPYFGVPTSAAGAVAGCLVGWLTGWSVCLSVRKKTFRRMAASAAGRRARARTAGGVAGFFVGLVVEVLGSVFASAFCSAGIHGTTLVLLQVAAAAMPLVVRAQMPGKGKRAFGFKSRHAEYYNTLVAGVLVAAYLLVAGFVVEPYVRERARGLRNLLAVSGLDTLTYWLGNWLSDALVLVSGAVCVVFMLAATRMAYRKRLCSSAPTYAQLHAAARKGDLDLGPYNATATSLEIAFHDRYPGGFEEDPNDLWHSEPYDTIEQWYCDSIWDKHHAAGARQNATKFVVRRWMERWPWLWILLPLCSAGIVSFSHFATTTFDSPLIAVASTPIFIGLLGGAAPAGLAGLWWVATSKPNQLLFQEFFCKIGWLASIATPFGNLAVQVCKVAFHPQLKRGGFLEASGDGPLWRQRADPPLPSGWAAVIFAFFHIILYEGIVVFKDRRALRPLAWVKTRVSKVRATAMPDDVAAERARVAALTGAGDAASAGDALSTNEDDFQIVVDEPEEEAPPSRPPPTRFSTAVRDTVAMLRNVPPGDDPYPPPLVRDIKSADRDGLVVSDLRKIYPPRFFGGSAVESVQCAAFGVPTGQVFGLLGANGAGKTTTVSMVCRAVEPTSGDARVAGKSVLADFEDAARSLGVVNQKNVLWDHLSCRDHLSLFARLRGVDIEGDARHAAEQALAVVGLSDHADKAAGRLSGGMKRKLAVAVALVGGPSVVLLDEPSSGLDPGAQRNLWDLIKVTMKGRAVVLTTHSMGEADLLCDRLGIMVKGTMRCIGTPQELKERYAAGYEISCRLETRDDAHVADLVAFAREAFSSPDVDVAAADADIATLELAGVDPRRTPALAFRAFDDDACARLGVIDFSLARATMEKVFLRIAGGEEGLAQSRLGREIAEMLQAEADDDAQKELDKVVFSEATSCGCTRFAWDNLCFHSFAWFFFFTGLWMVSALVPQRFDTCVWWEHHESKGHLRRCGRHDYWFKAPTMFYYSPMGLLVGISLMGWTMFCHPCAVWCLRAPSRTGAVAPA